MKLGVALVMFLACRAAGAGFYSGNEMLSDCRSEDFYERSSCLGYIAGISGADDAYTYWGDKKKESICLRDKVTLGQLRLVVINWLEARPEKLDKSADYLVPQALEDAFPCK